MKKLYLAALLFLFSTMQASAGITQISSWFRVTSPDTLAGLIAIYCEEYLQVEDANTGILYEQRGCASTPYYNVVLTPAAKDLLKQDSNADIAATLFNGTSSQYVRGDGTIADFPEASSFSISYPSSRSVSLGTAYQCTDTTKPCQVTVNVRCPLSLSLLTGATCEGEVRVGNSSSVSTGGGTNIAPIYRNASGVLGLSTNDTETKVVSIPTGGYFAVRQTSGTVNIVSVYEQAIGQ